MHYVYIIYSKAIDRYYIGETEDFEQRLRWHNEHQFIGSFTTRATDWERYLVFEMKDIQESRKFEAHLKSQKSRKYIESLKSNRKKITKLVEKYGLGHCPDILE
ncbi:MAG: GIY-YIG nuclease family protein [Saprospiraceae bacterium]|nr:GIY-YIG nuclease family protein [Saprospiraceae bacterium]